MPKLRTNPDNTRQLTTGPGYRYLLATDGPCPCCEGEPPPPGEFYAAKPCDACGDDSITVWVQATNSSGDWIFDPYPDRECLYFRLEPPWPGFGCFYIHREDATHELDPGPLNYLTGEHVKPDIFSCCQCCVDDCLTTHHGVGNLQWLRDWADYVNYWGENIIVPTLDCCCDTNVNGYSFALRWDSEYWLGTSSTCPTGVLYLRLKALGRWIGQDGRIRVFADGYDPTWGGTRPPCRIEGWGNARWDFCVFEPWLTSDDCNEATYSPPALYPYQTPITRPAIIHRAALEVDCNHVMLRSDIEVPQDPPAYNCFRLKHTIDFEWQYIGADSCLETCDRTTPGPRKKPRPQPPDGGEIQPIGVQPILGPP